MSSPSESAVDVSVPGTPGDNPSPPELGPNVNVTDHEVLSGDSPSSECAPPDVAAMVRDFEARVNLSGDDEASDHGGVEEIKVETVTSGSEGADVKDEKSVESNRIPELVASHLSINSVTPRPCATRRLTLLDPTPIRLTTRQAIRDTRKSLGTPLRYATSAATAFEETAPDDDDDIAAVEFLEEDTSGNLCINGHALTVATQARDINAS